MPPPSAHPDFEHLIVVADADRDRSEALRALLEAVPGRNGDAAAPPRPRYGVRVAHECEGAMRLVTDDVSALVCDLDTGRGNAVELIERLRPQRPDLAILCYSVAPRAEVVAAMTAGADHYVQYGDGAAVPVGLDLALDRRWLTQLIERAVSDIDEARRRLARMSNSNSVVLPGLRPPAAAHAVMPFHEAVRRYLEACARLFDGDPRGLAERLGISYFALRRLLKRYHVPFPGRTLAGRSKRGTGTKR